MMGEGYVKKDPKLRCVIHIHDPFCEMTFTNVNLLVLFWFLIFFSTASDEFLR
jgi:hypothetical protein